MGLPTFYEQNLIPNWGTYLMAPPLKAVYVADEEAKKRYKVEKPWNAYEIIALNNGIENAQMGENVAGMTGYYDLNGRRIGGKQGGPVIVRYSDGSTRKMMVK